MNLGASMVAKRVHQSENEEPHFGRGLLIGIPAAIVLWVALYYIGMVLFG